MDRFNYMVVFNISKAFRSGNRLNIGFMSSYTHDLLSICISKSASTAFLSSFTIPAYLDLSFNLRYKAKSPQLLTLTPPLNPSSTPPTLISFIASGVIGNFNEKAERLPSWCNTKTLVGLQNIPADRSGLLSQTSFEPMSRIECPELLTY